MFESLLARIGRALDDARIPYMVIGGQAVLQYGEPRLTRDIDITLGIDIDKIDKILSLVKSLGLAPSVKDVETFLKTTNVLPASDGVSGVRVDFLFSSSPYEREAIARAVPIRVSDYDVCYATVEDIIIHKVVAGRPRDLDDVKGILCRNPHYDRTYVRQWLSSLGNALTIDFLSRFSTVSK